MVLLAYRERFATYILDEIFSFIFGKMVNSTIENVSFVAFRREMLKDR
jgi:hypothetical protein